MYSIGESWPWRLTQTVVIKELYRWGCVCPNRLRHRELGWTLLCWYMLDINKSVSVYYFNTKATDGVRSASVWIRGRGQTRVTSAFDWRVCGVGLWDACDVLESHFRLAVEKRGSEMVGALEPSPDHTEGGGDLFLKTRFPHLRVRVTDASSLFYCFVFNRNATTIDYYQYIQDLWMGSHRAGLTQECEISEEHPDVCFCYLEKNTGCAPHWYEISPV